ncbi:BlaI/MecI/CopY family transcriptional regulator [Clostridium botulinum]|uniref:BlaI/MecI/CopY family transcriptional regulator n=1 Tax=Clostridium TaxID=1485 RepID=UPI0001F85042|nr:MULTISPECIES: BlaI/MecI/CopY family transcriptional regulator [Clostridium]MCJ8171193.1 BlaI/MecI/CopY family transcriptional regulator [Clostridium botulinum]NFB15696.1 BlaI/MecI/CopY family transcriptional regulator [Clostridium botulinum]NFB66120.1 BlaI/MecI/CopY family transcriptional regulator [Clostridium botulinum]NFB96918.1 BlaI/MecI/CopY family transcriptional regulator [Clostridium botulinum]NFC45917.1 BlaI/MecI/CopY family transcriptional regulator [Clostridium botulinum]
MGDIPKISETEWKVMKIIWSNPYITANEVIDILDDYVEWKPKTVKTLLNRLLNKGAIHFEKEGREYKYYPLVSEDECIKEENKSFLDRVYNGAFKTMIANFIEEQNLTKEDIDDLKKLLEKNNK